MNTAHQIELAYGRDKMVFAYDPQQFAVLDNATNDPRAPLGDAEINVAFDAPIGCAPLADKIAPGDTVLIVVSDATRVTGSAQVVNLLVRRLIENGIAPFDIRIIFATGIHRAVTFDEAKTLLTPFIVQRLRILTHDPNAENEMVLLGTTERGTPVEVNRALVEHTHVILTGGIGFHYFAGFTGGRKSVCPGLASARTIRATHLLALDENTGTRRKGVGTGLLDGNAVHEECAAVTECINPSFLINTICDARGRIEKIYTGDWRAAHAAGCIDYLATHSTQISEKRPLVVVSTGGTPSDVNLIQAHKALEMATHACLEGGTIIWLAQCAEGLGREDFLQWFDSGRATANDIAAQLQNEYQVNGQTAWTLRAKTEKFRVFMVTNLADEAVRQMGMTPAPSLAAALSLADANASGYLLPYGARILPLLNAEAENIAIMGR